MKELAKFLVESILEEAAGMDNVVVVYSGRFQPFHKGHYATYDNLVRKFGKNSVYIGTSNVTDSKKSPFNFKEKKAIMMQMFGIPSNKIVNIKNPYAPEEILKKYDSDTTGLIVVVGEKDQNRLSGKYFTPYKGKVEQGYLDKGYVYASPSQPNPISGTDVRYWLSAGSSDDRKKNFTKAYPKFDSQIFKLITLKLKGLKECINEEIKLNVKVGDTLLMGKFKNKKVVVKSIGEDEWGMPTINGKKAVTFRIPKKEELKEAASNVGMQAGDEPDTSFVSDGQKRILNTAKPENWYKQGGYTQMDIPKADAMRGRGKSKDTETQFRKSIYKIKNVVQSTLNPADDPFKVEDWQDAYRENPNEKPKRFWELPTNQKDTIISKEDIKEIVSDFDSLLDEMGFPGGAGVGLSLPGGYINGSPDSKDVKKNSKKLNNKGMSGYEEIDEDKIPGGLAKGKTIIDLAKKYDSKGYYDPKQYAEEYIKPKLMQGIKVEMEHTTDVRIATEIAMDHLWENLEYYDKLAKIENPTNEGLKDLEKELVVLYNKAFKMMPKSPAQMKVRAEIDKLKKQIDSLKKESITEAIKWESGVFDKCLKGEVPLSLNIIKKLVDPIVAKSLHVTDIENLPKVAALEGTKKSISTFNKTTKWGKIAQGKGLWTKGGVLVSMTGTILAQSIHDLWTYPDKQGRRWIEPGVMFDNPSRSRYQVYDFAPELKPYREKFIQQNILGEIPNQEKADFIKKYFVAAEKFMLSRKKEFVDRYSNANTLYYDSDWNEVVLTNIKIDKILIIPSDEDETEIQKIKQKYHNVEVARNETDIQNFIKKNGGRIIESTSQTKDLIMEGGAYGHMNHPFDIEMNLTFGDLKQIVVRALNGDLELAREKTDGQALAVSWVNGRLVAARNKSHLKNKGAGAMTIGQVADKFAGRGGLTDAYNFAMQDLSKAIAALSEPQRKKIFKDGSSFMNLEVIYPTSVNVIPYNQPLLVFHGTFDYDMDGTIVGENQQAASILGGMIKQVNAHVQSKYTIQGPPINKLPKSEHLSKLQGKYLGMISKLQSEFSLHDSDGVADYHQAWWTNFVEKKAKKLDYQQKIGLVKRWAFGDKSFRIAEITDDKLRAWADQTDKQDQQKISKQNLMRFEEIFLGVGADVLSFMDSVLTANPDSAKRQMVARLQSTIQQVKASGDPKKIEKLKLELSRLNALGGFEKIVPNEGIVFVYGGNTYKLTGAFAPLNQILGIFFDS
jgi:phosphopantetheine adenylyltransferase